ncbi:MAG: hypothetical protein KF774_02845 [Planctomyces sp.]|nr:hypothetical protein [Planctomyces sp.]
MIGSLLLTAGLLVGADATAADAANLSTYTSYTKAWHAAKEASRPMLVVLNPSSDSGKAAAAVKVEELRKAEELTELMDDFVVVEIDTSTTHGKKIHEIFGSPALPRVVVIDSQQVHQVFATSTLLTNTQLKSVLEKARVLKTSATKLSFDWMPKPAGDCPNCRRSTNSFSN